MSAYYETHEPPHCPTCDCCRPGQAVELALEKVLRAAGMKLTSYTPATQEALRETMREVVGYAYIKGSKDCHSALVLAGVIRE